MIDNTIKVCESILNKKNKDTPMYGAIPEECENVKKVMGEVSSILKGNGLYDLLCERA